ncbi:PAS domain-containing sensor histidine kinase [Gemmatimonadota bacterium]
MLRRHQLVWKVNGVFLAILVCALGISGYVTNVMQERDALASARDISRVSSNLIFQNIRELMIRRHPAGLSDLVYRFATDNPIYTNIRVVAHDGRVVAAIPATDTTVVDASSWPCNVCHEQAEATYDSTVETYEDVIELENQGRVVSLVTPVVREEGCAGSECHDPSGVSPILGVLQADFSLSSVDGLKTQRNRHTILAVLVSVILGTIATWWLMDHLVGQRIRTLREGAHRISQKDFSFRFSDDRGDGLAELEGAFDNMTSELSSTLSELTSTKEYLQGIVESSADMIITVDPNGLIRTFNTGAERILGYRREEVIGESVEILFADPRERDIAIAQLEHDDHVINYETHIKTWDGEVRNMILTLSRLRSPDGTPIGTFGISKDITKEKALQRQLLQSERLAAIGQAVTGIQHSMKNMLNALKGGSYMVKVGIAKEDLALLEEGWGIVQQGIESMTMLSKKMLLYAKDLKPELEKTDLAKLLGTIHHVVSQTTHDQGIEFSMDVEEDLPLVLCDSGLVHSVVMDLVSNSIDACAQHVYENGGPNISVGVRHPLRSDHVVIEVSDNGGGMPEDVIKHIFTPFFSTKKKLGTGMGLTLTKRMVSAHGGTLKVESTPGSGSTFQVLLPIDGPKV